MIKRLLNKKKQADRSVEQLASDYFSQGYNCAQSVLLANAGEVDPSLMEIAKSFGAGIGGAKCLCGAVSGGVMALSLAGKGKRGRLLVEAFRKEHRVTCCSALSSKFKWRSKEHRANCQALTVSAAKMTEQLLGDD